MQRYYLRNGKLRQHENGEWVRAEDVERLQTECLANLRAFLDTRYPSIDGPGWLKRQDMRSMVQEFLLEFVITTAAGGKDANNP